ESFDIVHPHYDWTNIISRFATPRKIKLLNHYHFADYDTMKNKPSVKRMVMIDKLFHHRQLVRIGVSEYVGNILRNTFPGSNIAIIPNFINCAISKNPVSKNVDDALKLI